MPKYTILVVRMNELQARPVQIDEDGDPERGYATVLVHRVEERNAVHAWRQARDTQCQIDADAWDAGDRTLSR